MRHNNLSSYTTSSIIPAVDGESSLCNLPTELLEAIFSKLSYDDITKLRPVCRTFNQSACRLLNLGFTKVEKYFEKCLKQIKCILPRRESERRIHPLSTHCDVLSKIETRLSLLSVTFTKYIKLNLCCFFPGKVIDEIYRVLSFIERNANHGIKSNHFDTFRVSDLVKELRDISSMAMEYFEEKIAPQLKYETNVFYTPRTSFRILSPQVISEVTESRKFLAEYCRLVESRKLLKKIKKQDQTISELKAMINEQAKKFENGEKIILDQQRRLNEMEAFLRRHQTLDDSQIFSKSSKSIPILKNDLQLSLDRILTRSMKKRASDGNLSAKACKKRKQLGHEETSDIHEDTVDDG